MNKKEFFISLPSSLQNLVISLYNTYLYSQRYGNVYKQRKTWLKKVEYLSKEQLETMQSEKLRAFLAYTMENSDYYKMKYSGIDVSKVKTAKDLPLLPILNKEEIVSNLEDIVTKNIDNGLLSKTGGTTGLSMKVYYDKDDSQERFAFLDHFRERFGYKVGKRTAWLSGKDFIGPRDLKNNNYWKYDFINKVRFYSTFHINKDTVKYYLDDIKRFKPLFIVGFPSSIAELAHYGQHLNYDMEGHKVNAVFPTAETVTDAESESIKDFFGGGVYDQYASSEGAPFIVECEERRKHFEILSGVIETIDDQGNSSDRGKMLVTAFATSMTPLIRYDIGDSMEWDIVIGTNCKCGRETPVVKQIHGRVNDFIYSKEMGRVNLGNISNCVKSVNGILRFQIVQKELGLITVNVLIDDNVYGRKDEENFEKELRARLGDIIRIEFMYPDVIEKEKSGKYRIVKNHIADQI